MKLYTEYGERLNRNRPLPNYPRPQLERDNFTMLNGMWYYQITKRDEQYHDEWKPICVPFPLGSELSGTDENLEPGQAVYYFKRFEYHCTGARTFLNFEAVDQCCEIYLNQMYVGHHEGGYLPFSIDVTTIIEESNELIVKCWDDTTESIYATGKQSLNPGGIWYKPFAGIWQSVWLEETGEHYIEDVTITPYYDQKSVLFQIKGYYDQAVITIAENGKSVAKVMTIDKQFTYTFEDFVPWSPDDPHLYEVYIETEDDVVKSYFGMRKFERKADTHGYQRFYLNDEPLFLSGLLDQGYTPDGLVTYCDDRLMVQELKKVKEMGFNMLRKHVKIENRRWYYHCDRLGILVMQDMVNSMGPYNPWLITVKGMLGSEVSDKKYKTFGVTPEGKNEYIRQIDLTIQHLYNVTSIFAWVVFNEGWGQFDSVDMAQRVAYMDDSRLVDHASGWFDQGAGDFFSRHVYFRRYKHKLDPVNRIIFLSEFGGYSYVECGHAVVSKSFGYKHFKDKLVLDDAIGKLFRNEILPAIPKGLAGCIYTQVSDVENECNGLMTYDRKIVKIDEEDMFEINEAMRKAMTQ